MSELSSFPCCLIKREDFENLVAALEPFAEIASVKGGTDGAKELRSVINRIMECAPYPDDLKAIEQFCNAILNARAVLDSIKDLPDA